VSAIFWFFITELKRPHGRHRHRWEDNIKVYLHGVVMWVHRLNRSGSGYGEFAGTCEYTDEYSGSIKSSNYVSKY
jgi:hypothetical protein